ncbi:MAG TPA: acyl carrier protein [Allosphingosinicella sp.]|nr:acyl carrier protein [Allosphingosinicella sp.]
MSDRMAVTDRVRAFVEERIGRPVAVDEKYFETGSVSSLFGLEIICYIEQQFGLAVDDDDLVLENFDSIANLAAFVGRKRERL